MTDRHCKLRGSVKAGLVLGSWAQGVGIGMAIMADFYGLPATLLPVAFFLILGGLVLALWAAKSLQGR